VVAAAKLPTVTDVPLHFKAVSITLQPDEKSGVSAANGIRYQMSGSTEVVLDGEAKKVNTGEGLFVAGGKTAALTAGSEGPSNFLHFFLAPAGDLGRPLESAPAVVLAPSATLSTVTVPIPRRRNSAASARPLGPAPTIRMSVFERSSGNFKLGISLLLPRCARLRLFRALS
jgi:hypothetical protein